LSEKWLALRVMAFAAVVPLLMRFPLTRVARWLDASGDSTSAVAIAPPCDVAHLIRRIDGWLVRGRPVVRRGCVVRGVTLYRFLRGAGVPVSLRFGVGLVEQQIEGHCWIVHQDLPLGERVDPRPIFTEMVSIPS
jgi:hypothetical protein